MSNKDVGNSPGPGEGTVADLKSLGSWIDDMKTRKAQALVACNKLGKIWKSKLCRELKVMVFLATVESVFLYGSETWTLQDLSFIEECLQRGICLPKSEP